jgi:Domain of unknown function (DUF4112)
MLAPRVQLSPQAVMEKAIVVEGELIDHRIADVEAVARWMDYIFVLPGGFRFGFSGIIGLVPGIGDLIDAMVSVYIVWRAIQIGIPRVTITRMVLNVGIEGILGAAPFIGDLFDVIFKANRRNYELLSTHMTQSSRQRRLDWVFVMVTVLIVAAGVILPIWALVAIINYWK